MRRRPSRLANVRRLMQGQHPARRSLTTIMPISCRLPQRRAGCLQGRRQAVHDCAAIRDLTVRCPEGSGRRRLPAIQKVAEVT
jgi:hypothetical protein